MQKTILFGKEARDKVMKGIDTVANAVKVTLGANGKTVLIKHAGFNPNGGGLQYWPLQQTKDGVSVARSLTLSDQIENMGADIVKDAAGKTMDLIGDGTTTTCVLVQAIASYGLALLEEGKSSNEIKRDIDAAVIKVVEFLKKEAIPVDNDLSKIKQIATVSANNDESIGQLIADAFEKMGTDGVISIEESKTGKTYIDVADGFQFENGWITKYFYGDNAKEECILENPVIFLYEKKLVTMVQVNELMQLVWGKMGRSLLIICDDAEGEALATIVTNVYQKKVPISCIVKAPSFGVNRTTAMEDLALLTGAEYISEEKGHDLEAVSEDIFGSAKRVIVSKGNTVIVGGGGNKKKISDMVNNLRMDITKANPQEKEVLEKRIAKLNAGAAILYVGGATETEMKEVKDRCDDAVRAVKAAISEGYVAGGGSLFVRAAKLDIPDFMKLALEAPFRQICTNSGVEADNKISKLEASIGYNAKTDAMEDLVVSGIIDPVKALRCSLEHAASAAATLISSEALICDTM